MSAELTYREDVAVLTLNRPKALNALNAEMVGEIAERLDEVAVSKARALLIVGAGGGKAFAPAPTWANCRARMPTSSAKPHGVVSWCLPSWTGCASPRSPLLPGWRSGRARTGDGLHLSHRDAHVAPRAPEIKLGLIPGYGGTQRLPRLVGVGRAVELIASGRAIDAQEAERIGLIHRIVEAEDPVDAGAAYLKSLGEPFPASLGHALEAIRHSQSMRLEDGLQEEAECFSAATQTWDADEGVTAFLGKRKPQFAGH